MVRNPHGIPTICSDFVWNPHKNLEFWTDQKVKKSYPRKTIPTDKKVKNSCPRENLEKKVDKSYPRKNLEWTEKKKVKDSCPPQKLGELVPENCGDPKFTYRLRFWLG